LAIDEPVRAHVVVLGRVQGVWFRASTKDVAQRLALAGWVRNVPDGSVEAVFEGPRASVDAAIAWAGEGPDHAVVDDVRVDWEEPLGEQGFAVR
jgi:acylphosphatase